MASAWSDIDRCVFVKVVTMGLLLALPFAAFAQRGATFVSAAFGAGEYSLAERLRTPIERPSGDYDVTLRCQVIVEPDGSTRLPRCLAAERYAAFRLEAERALAGAILTPARIDDEPVRVLLNLIIGYRCAETCPAYLFRNHGRNTREFGFTYSTPQPVLDDDTWYEGFDEKLAWAAGGLPPVGIGGVRFVISANIHESGRTSQRRVDDEFPGSSDRDYETLADDAADSLRDARYIPGFFQGEPVEMRLYEYWLDPDGAPLPTLTLPIRAHILWSDIVPALDSTLTDEQVREMFAVANDLWRPAAIQWEIESIAHTQAEGQLGFRRAVIDDPEGLVRGNDETFARICPDGAWLASGWNICFARATPGGALYFNTSGAAVLGKRDVLSEEIVPPFALAHVLGHMLGLRDAQRCAATFMRWFEGAGTANPCGNPSPVDMSDAQIKQARIRATVGRPSRGERRP